MSHLDEQFVTNAGHSETANQGHRPPTTEELLAQRGQIYGDAVDTHTRIAQAWSAILDHQVSALDVALCMISLKLVRASCAPDHMDSYADIAGYNEIAKRIVG